MGGKKNGSKNNSARKEKNSEAHLLPPSIRGYLLSLVFLLLSLIILLSFFGLAAFSASVRRRGEGPVPP